MAAQASDADPWTDRGSLRRQEVLDRSAELFAARGFHATSISDIAAATMLKRASLYHYFVSKAHILAEILERGIEDLLTDATEAATTADPVQRLQALLVVHLKHFGQKRPQVIVFLMEPNALEPDSASSYLQQRTAYDALFTNTIRDGQRLGVFRDDDPVIMAYSVLGMVNWMVQWYKPDGRLSLDEISAIMQRMALAAVGAPASDRSESRAGSRRRT